MRVLLQVFFLALAAPAHADAARPELELTEALFDAGKGGYEISGAAMVDKDLLIVSDDAKNHFLYRIEPKKKGGRIRLSPALDLSALAGWDKVQAAMKETLAIKEKHRRLDLEGIAACSHTIYLANEEVRHILVIEDKKSIAVAPIDFSGVKDLFDGGANAGFEGVAADCVNKVLYIAKEREPRRIFKVDATTWKVLDAFDIPSSDRGGQKVINFNNGEGLMDLSADFSDLFFENGFLYAIERNTYEITKIDPATKQVLARVSYYTTEKPLYETHEPFGIAEALYMNDAEIWLGLDNNGTTATHFTAKKYGFKGDGGAFLVFKRPKGF